MPDFARISHASGRIVSRGVIGRRGPAGLGVPDPDDGEVGQVVGLVAPGELGYLDGAGVSDGDKGDVTVASSGSAWTVPGLATLAAAITSGDAASVSTAAADATTKANAAQAAATSAAATDATTKANAAQAAAATDATTKVGVETARATAAEALLIPLAQKDAASGVPGLSTGQAITSNLQAPERRFVHDQRGANLFLAQAASIPIKCMLIADSMGSSAATDAEQTAFPAVYEAEMARRFNIMPRSSGWVPIQCWNSVTGEGGMAWGTSGTDYPSGQNEARGPNIANKRITNSGINFARTDPAVRRFGTAVTVFWTRQGTGGAVADVSINGTVVGQIDTRGGTAGTYDSGHSTTFTRSGYGPIDLLVTHTGTGTTVELEGAYFHADNDTSGFQLLRAHRAGQGWDRVAATDLTTLMQVVANYQPHMIDIALGHNDYLRSRTPENVAADMATVFAAIDAQYSTWTPAVRVLFQNMATDLPANWITDYRVAMRQACTTAGVTFLDGHEAIGSFATDEWDASTDNIHPLDRAHYVWGQLLADTAVRPAPRATFLRLGDNRLQSLGSTSVAAIGGVTGAQINLYRTHADGSAVGSGVQVGVLGFGGIANASTGGLGLTAAIRGKSEEAYTTSARGTGLELLVTAVGASTFGVAAGVTAGGALYVGASLAAAAASISSTGIVLVGNGTASLPGVSFISDPDTGLYRVGANSLGLATGGTLRLTIDSTGLAAVGAVKSSSASGGVGYATGAGGAVTQATSKSTGVTLNAICGQITTTASTLNSGLEVSFTLTNSAIAATDVVIVNIGSGATVDTYLVAVTAVAAGSCRISLTNVSGSSASEAIVLNFAVIKAVAA